MRLLLDTLVALMLAGILGGVVYARNREASFERDLAATRADVRLFERMIAMQAALGRVPLNEQGFPRTIDPEWFVAHMPRNRLLSPGRPWVEVASWEDRDLAHPIAIVADDASNAAFWYNPATGIVRARVPGDTSDRTARQLYNRVNRTELGKDA